MVVEVMVEQEELLPGGPWEAHDGGQPRRLRGSALARLVVCGSMRCRQLACSWLHLGHGAGELGRYPQFQFPLPFTNQRNLPGLWGPGKEAIRMSTHNVTGNHLTMRH